jgi:glycosyltransferase involved in cell wall biosynthesis
MRIAVVTTSYPAFAGDPCGHFVEAHAKKMAELHDVVVIAPEHVRARPPEPDGASRSSVTVLRLPGHGAFGWPGVVSRIRSRPYRLVGAMRWAALARRALASLSPLDRVVAHWALPSGWPIAHDRGVPLELISHGQDVRSLARLPPPLRRHVVRALLRRAEVWTFVSSSLQASLALTLDRDDARRLDAITRIEPCAIEIPDVASAIQARRHAHSDARLFVCVGRLVPSKRVDRVLDHVARECASGKRARLVVVGDGPLRARLERQARASGVDAIFVGRTTREAALAWIGAADAVLHASEAEGLSTVEREAQALGVPFSLVADGR